MKRSGVTLVEILATIALLAAFMLVSMHLFRSLVGWIGVGANAGAQHRELRAATQQLRADVWTAYDIAVGSEHVVVLRLSGDRTVAWEVTTEADTGDRVLRRTSWRSPAGIAEAQPGAHAKQIARRHWPIRPGSARFEAHETGVTFVRLITRGGASEPTDRRPVHLYSQVVMHQGGER